MVTERTWRESWAEMAASPMAFMPEWPPTANLINLVVLDSTGASTDSIVIAGIQRAIQLQSQYNIQVINLSLGRPVFESYTRAIRCARLWKQLGRPASSWWWPPETMAATIRPDTDGYSTITAPETTLM